MEGFSSALFSHFPVQVAELLLQVEARLPSGRLAAGLVARLCLVKQRLKLQRLASRDSRDLVFKLKVLAQVSAQVVCLKNVFSSRGKIKRAHDIERCFGDRVRIQLEEEKSKIGSYVVTCRPRNQPVH